MRSVSRFDTLVVSVDRRGQSVKKEIYFPVVTVDQQNLRERYSALWSSCPLEFKRVIGGRETTARAGRSKHARFVTFSFSGSSYSHTAIDYQHQQTYTLLMA